MVRITDNLDITIVVDWDLNRIKQKSIFFSLNPLPGGMYHLYVI